MLFRKKSTALIEAEKARKKMMDYAMSFAKLMDGETTELKPRTVANLTEIYNNIDTLNMEIQELTSKIENEIFQASKDSTIIRDTKTGILAGTTKVVIYFNKVASQYSNIEHERGVVYEKIKSEVGPSLMSLMGALNSKLIDDFEHFNEITLPNIDERSAQLYATRIYQFLSAYFLIKEMLKSVTSKKMYPVTTTTQSSDFETVIDDFPGWRKDIVELLKMGFLVGMNSDELELIADEEEKYGRKLTDGEKIYLLQNHYGSDYPRPIYLDVIRKMHDKEGHFQVEEGYNPLPTYDEDEYEDEEDTEQLPAAAAASGGEPNEPNYFILPDDDEDPFIPNRPPPQKRTAERQNAETQITERQKRAKKLLLALKNEPKSSTNTRKPGAPPYEFIKSKL